MSSYIAPLLLIAAWVLGITLSFQAPVSVWEPASISRADDLAFRTEELGFDRLFVSNRAWASAVGGLARSDDEGKSWKVFSLPAGHRHLDSIFFESREQGWASGIQGLPAATAVLLRTDDGGETWKEWSSLASVGVRALLDFHFNPDGTGWAVGMKSSDQRGIILATDDYGRTWKTQHVDSTPLYRLAVGRNGRAWVGGNESILMTKNGTDWVVTHKGNQAVFEIEPVTENLVFAVLTAGILRSTDGGDHWEPVSLPAPYDRMFLGTIIFADADRGWASGHRGTILATTDGGRTWRFEAQLKSYFIRDMVIWNQRLIAVGDDGAIFWRDIEH